MSKRKRSRADIWGDKYVPFTPAGSVTVGRKVYWQRDNLRWWMGIVEVKRGRVCLIRDTFGHEHVVGVGMLFERRSPT